MAVKAVFFDVGETLVDETRYWEAIADGLGVPRFTFLGVFGGLIERCEDHRRVYELFGEPPARPVYERADFYPDALPCLEALRAGGYRIGLVGNQPAVQERFLREEGLEVDFVGSSESWGVAKPDPAFFRNVVEASGLEPGEIAYVGDRVDNDVVPAADAGMVAVFVRRGPWGYLQAGWPEAGRARVRVDSLAELAGALARV
jgi:HAD superfamily hydrolase (TIGR01509 family)